MSGLLKITLDTQTALLYNECIPREVLMRKDYCKQEAILANQVLVPRTNEKLEVTV